MIVDVGSAYRLGQVIAFLIALAVLGMSIAWMIRNPDRILYGIPLTVWMFHMVLFYIGVFLEYQGIFDPTGDDQIYFTRWSIILRIHGLLTLLALEIKRYTHEQTMKRLYAFFKREVIIKENVGGE